MNASGEVRDTYIVESMGEEFDQAFISAIEEADWQPARRNYERVQGRTTIAVAFNSDLNSSDPEPAGGIQSIYEELEYPETARQAGIEGQVVIEFTVDENGAVHDEQILQNIGGGTAEAAIEAIKTVEWNPGYQNGVPTSTTFQVPIRFSLAD